MKQLALIAGIAFFGWGAWQSQLPQIVTDNDQKLHTAKGFTAKYTIQVIGEAANPYELSFAKPNLFKLTTPDGWTLSDGKTIYDYTAKDNTWTETPVSEDAMKAFATKAEVWGWNSFFLENALKKVATAKVGPTRNMKGNVTTEVVETLVEEGKAPVTVYVDQKLGVVRSFRVQVSATKELIVLASDIAVSDKEPDASQFAFTAPSGAKKAEPVKVAAGVNYAAIQQIMTENCMPCHNAQNRRDGIDLTNYDGVSGIVTAGNPTSSLLVKSLRGNGAKRMPMNRAPLSEDKIKQVEAWISAGAKSN